MQILGSLRIQNATLMDLANAQFAFTRYDEHFRRC